MNFIKEHTLTFDRELLDRQKRKVGFPRPAFALTAACNLQRKMDFDQDVVIQTQWQNLVNYIVEVNVTLINVTLI